jgi:hypothetical protein
MHRVELTTLITSFWIKFAKIVWIFKTSWSVKDGLERESLEGIFGFFQVAYKSMVYFANSQHIYFLSELTLYTTILVHHVLVYVVVPKGSPVRDGWHLI